MGLIPSRLTRYLAELERRRVLRVVVTYALVAWLLLQIAEVTFAPLHLPGWAMTAAVVAAIAGFPIAFLLAWVFQRTPEGIERDAGPDAAPPRGPGRSIAVLAFADMSPEKDQDYFCEGVAEEILNRLARVDALHVASRTSSFCFKEQREDVGVIGRKLRVDTVLEGSVRKSGNRLRVTTQLINVADGYHLWSDSYDRELEDIFAIQDEIAQQVAGALEVTLGTARGRDSGTGDVAAYEAYLKGFHYFHRWGLRNVEFAVRMFTRAVDIDPGYARAWAALSDCHAMVCMYWRADRANLDGAERASTRALELAPDLPEAHVSRGLAHTVHGKARQAHEAFETAIRLNPQLFEAHYFFGRVCFQQGQLERAAALFERAESLRPDDFQAPIFLRQIYRGFGRKADAVEAARRGVERAMRHLELNPDDTRALNLGAGGYIELGEQAKAIELAERSLAVDSRNPDTLYNVACTFAQAGDIERALDALEGACLAGMQIAAWAEHDADLTPLHGQPRFRAILDVMREPGSQGK